jgi:hypothetical protein
VVDLGEPTSIARQYNAVNVDRGRRGVFERGELPALGQPMPAEILHAWFETAAGERTVSAAQGEPCAVKLDARFREGVTDPAFLIGLFDDDGRGVFVAHSHLEHGPSGHFQPGDRAHVTLEFENWLAPGRYHLAASIYGDPDTGLFDKREDFGTLIVKSNRAAVGAVDLPHSFQIARS